MHINKGPVHFLTLSLNAEYAVYLAPPKLCEVCDLVLKKGAWPCNNISDFLNYNSLVLFWFIFDATVRPHVLMKRLRDF